MKTKFNHCISDKPYYCPIHKKCFHQWSECTRNSVNGGDVTLEPKPQNNNFQGRQSSQTGNHFGGQQGSHQGQNGGNQQKQRINMRAPGSS